MEGWSAKDLLPCLRLTGAVRGGVAAGVGLGLRAWLRTVLGPAAGAARAFASGGCAKPVLLDVGGVGCIVLADSSNAPETRHSRCRTSPLSYVQNRFVGRMEATRCVRLVAL